MGSRDSPGGDIGIVPPLCSQESFLCRLLLAFFWGGGFLL